MNRLSSAFDIGEPQVTTVESTNPTTDKTGSSDTDMLHRSFWSISVAFVLLAISVAAQGKQYGTFLESYDVFQARYDGSAVSNLACFIMVLGLTMLRQCIEHASDPSYYPCCHPLPPDGKVDPKCRSVGDDCEEGEQNCCCESVEYEDWEEDDGDHPNFNQNFVLQNASSAGTQVAGVKAGGGVGGSAVTRVSARGWSALARAFLQMT
jgi:hypothetical protein